MCCLFIGLESTKAPLATVHENTRLPAATVDGQSHSMNATVGVGSHRPSSFWVTPLTSEGEPAAAKIFEGDTIDFE